MENATPTKYNNHNNHNHKMILNNKCGMESERGISSKLIVYFMCDGARFSFFMRIV